MLNSINENLKQSILPPKVKIFFLPSERMKIILMFISIVKILIQTEKCDDIIIRKHFKYMMEECNEDFGIQKQFTQDQRYKITAEKSKRRNILYQNYLEILEKIYKHYQKFSQTTQDLIKIKNNEKSIYVKEFKVFLDEILHTLKETSNFQIGCITEAQVGRDESVDSVTEDLLEQLPKYSEPQQNFLKELSELNSLKGEIKGLYDSLAVEYQDPCSFYNKKKMLSRKQNIQGKMQKVLDLQKKLEEKKVQMKSNIYGFEKMLQVFRKKLFNNKYNMLKKMKQTSKHSCQSLSQILMLLTKSVNSKITCYKKLAQNPQSDDLSVTQNKSRHRKHDDEEQVITSINNSVRQYNQVIDEVDSILKALDQGLKNLYRGVKEIIDQDKRNISQFINQVYEVQENPSAEIIDAFDLFLYFTQKFTSVSDKIYETSKNLYILKNNVKKHSDVIVSLRKSSMNNKMKSREENMAEKNERMDLLYEQISYDFIIEIIMSVYEEFKRQIRDLNDHFAKKFYRKKNRIQDSMDLSYFEETVIVVQKKPCKNQLWLWKDWKDRHSMCFESSLDLFKKMNDILDKILEEPEKNQLQKFECTLVGKKDLKGILKLRETYLQFQSLSSSLGNDISLIIPLREVEQIEVKIRAFGKKELLVETDKGEISFANFINIQQTRNRIKEKVESSGNTQVTKRRKQLILTSQELSAIQARKPVVQKERIKMDETWSKIESLKINGVRIDEVYEHIYSDKKFTLRGKPEETFMAFVMKKSGNINYVTTPYDQPGPEFYTQEPQATFSSCPIYSKRQIDYDHPLPPIPFMPKTCHLNEKSRLYWISHEEFDYSVISQTSGAPSSDTFYVKIHHIVQQKEDGVLIDIYGGVVFVKNSALKGMLKSKSEEELRAGVKNTCGQIVKSLRVLLTPASQTSLNQSRVSNRSSQSSPKPTDEVSKLKTQNKLLIIILIGVVILNILIQFIL